MVCKQRTLWAGYAYRRRVISRGSQYKDKTLMKSSYLYNGHSYTGTMISSIESMTDSYTDTQFQPMAVWYLKYKLTTIAVML